MHLVVFLAGFPNNIEETFEKLTCDDAFQQRVLSFFDSAITSSGELHREKLSCPSCKAKDSLKGIDIPKEAFAPQFRSQTPCPTVPTVWIAMQRLAATASFGNMRKL